MPLDVQRIWNACGEAFNRFTSAEDSFSENIERPAVEELIGDVGGAKILDLGCGSGPYSCRLAELGAEVIGFDLSEAMISLARGRARERNLKVDFRVADIRDALPFDDSQFDIVFTATALHYVDNLAIFMREAARVMNPRGRFVASVLHPLSTANFPLAGSEAVEGPDPWQGWYFGSPIRSIETPWLSFGSVPDEGRRIFCHHHTIAEYFDAFRSAGLAVTRLLEPAPPLRYAERNAARYDEAMRSPIYLILQGNKPD
ncbi:MAG TPA: class I SAM-dependent methyltransferase [Blastocatellia bacterium]|nr:class I SAM-dependent methyltransferase [Blastocatellia bacterium]